MPSKHILLMYISDVSGHRNAALAIEKALRIVEPEVEIFNINAFNYTNPISEKIVNRLYMGVIKRAPKIWNYLYDNPNVIKNLEKLRRGIHKFNSPKLKKLFDNFRPNLIVCTQAFPCGMVADFKKNFNLETPLIAVLTDYVPHSYWIYDTVDYYVTPSDDVSLRLVKKGVSAQRIKTLGIPFDPKFNQDIPKDEIMQRLNLRADLPKILIMGGGQGLGPIKTIVKSLEKLKMSVQELVVTGTNKRLYRSLKEDIRRYKNKILVFGYINNINELMSIADILITKPGGITTAEALAKKIPMIIIKPIPGQEANNAEYLTKKGAAIRLDRPQDINLVIEDLFDNPCKLKQMQEVTSRIAKPNSSLDIARLLLNI